MLLLFLEQILLESISGVKTKMTDSDMLEYDIMSERDRNDDILYE